MFVELSSLWLLVLVAAVFCWLASSLIHMVLKYHNADYQELGAEAEIADSLRGVSPALYTMPHCADMKAMGSDEMQKKFSNGPVAMITVMPDGMPPMGKLLSQHFLFFIIGSVFIAYLASMSIHAGAEYLTVFRHVFVASFLAYGWGQVPFSIWMGQPWGNCVRYLLDSLIYAAVTAGVFAWLWPVG